MESYEQGQTDVLVAKTSLRAFLVTFNWLQLPHWLVLEQTGASGVAGSRVKTYVER